MLVNNIDIFNYNAKLTSKNIGIAAVTIYDDWLKDAMNPIYFGKQETYKQLKLSFYIKDIDDNSALMDISNLCSQLEKCTIKFDNIDFLYDCLISDTPDPQKLTVGKYTLDVTLKAYAYLPMVSRTYNLTFDGFKDTSIDIDIQGNIPVPIIITAKLVSSDVDQNFKFNVPDNADTTGWLKNCFILRPLYKNMELTVDSEKCLVYEGVEFIVGNAYSDFFGDFITLQPGHNTIPVGFESMNTTVQLELTISYKPRFI